MKRRALSWQIGMLLAATSGIMVTAPPSRAQDASDAQNPQDAPTTQPPANKSKAKTLKAMVVTAERREQNIQAVPLTVSAMDQVELNRRGITSVADLNAIAPGLVVIPETGGYTTGAQFSLRGQFVGNPAMYWDSTTGVYVNGVYFGKSKVDVFSLPDLERIEVLNGPQGTLYGRNTIGGAVNIVTQKPSGVFTGTAQAGIGRYGEHTEMLRMDLPALGKLKVSVGGRAKNQDGWVKTTSGSSAGSLGKIDTRDAYADFLLDATDNLSIEYRYDFSNAHNTPAFGQTVHSDILKVFHIPGIIVNQDRQTHASIDAPVYENLRTDANALHVDWKLGVGTIKYIGAHSETHYNNGLELDGSPINFAQSQETNRYRETSHELQYVGSVGNWNWVTGLYYFEDKGFNADPQEYFFGAAVFDPNLYWYGSRSRAAYGQVEYKLNDQWTITAGLRRTLDQKNVSRFMQAGGYTLVPRGTEASAGWGSTTPMLNISYQMDPNHLLYARYAEGFLSGGFNAEAQTASQVTSPYKPEKAKTLEFGSKNTLLGGAMRLNADVFYNRTTNLQQIVFTAQGAAASNVLNVGRSHTYGFEGQLQWRATNDFDMGLNYSYMKGKFDKYMQLGKNIANNQSYAMLPRHILSLTAHDVLLRTSNGTLGASLDYRFTSGYYRYTYQKVVVNPAQAVAGNTRIKAEGILNGRIAFSDMQWGKVSGEVALWVNNITNKSHIDNYIDFGPGFGNLRLAYYNMPRTYGVTVRVDW
ncbi:MAG: TonB-dependent receptor [Rhodanobacter sp.]|nr:MAG: TonB-dependent receptor [Rhodanobacter sp.]TAM12739.1 MAG: TonB-dependent receptor [Rhodanobacter sp.]TAM37561.1 MAG: TonB-dependent receptor [Rhodanobacter sp.]